MNNNTKKLFKNNESKLSSLESSKKFHYTKSKMNSICDALCISTQDYKPLLTIRNIESYLDKTDKINRILYSEISNYIFSLDEEKRGVFATNVEKLLLCALNNQEITEDCSNMIVKIYDHFQLAINQIENVGQILGGGIEGAKFDLKKEIKKY